MQNKSYVVVTQPDSDSMLKVSAVTDPKALGSTLAIAAAGGQMLTMYCVGAGAVNQAVKASAIARGFAAPRGIDLAWITGFMDVEAEGTGKRLSAILLKTVVLR
jgi:stage V sporulation protein S